MDKTTMMNVDPRFLQRASRQLGFTQGLSPDQAQMVRYRITTAKWSPSERIVYDAVSEGYTDLDSLPIVTGLDSKEVTKSLDSLVAKGLIAPTISDVISAKSV